RPKRSTSAPSVLTAMPKLPTSAYAVLLRQNGMRTPPKMATRFVVVTMASFANGKWERCWYHAPPVVAAHCMPYVFDLDRLDRLAAARRAEFADASPYPHAVIDDFLDATSAADIARAFPQPDDAVGWDRFGIKTVEMKLASAREELFPEPLRRAIRDLNTGPFVGFLERLTRIEAHRRLNLLVYLTPDWRAGYGGELELWDTTGTRLVRRVEPLFNRAVIFATRSDTFHGHPNPWTAPSGVYRQSIALYYYTSQRPEAELRAPHSTLYKGHNACLRRASRT